MGNAQHDIGIIQGSPVLQQERKMRYIYVLTEVIWK
jgi:hypothetical protein